MPQVGDPFSIWSPYSPLEPLDNETFFRNRTFVSGMYIIVYSYTYCIFLGCPPKVNNGPATNNPNRVTGTSRKMSGNGKDLELWMVVNKACWAPSRRNNMEPNNFRVYTVYLVVRGNLAHQSHNVCTSETITSVRAACQHSEGSASLHIFQRCLHKSGYVLRNLPMAQTQRFRQKKCCTMIHPVIEPSWLLETQRINVKNKAYSIGLLFIACLSAVQRKAQTKTVQYMIIPNLQSPSTLEVRLQRWCGQYMPM